MNKIKVLLVDDEPYIRQGLSVLIDWNKYGFEICGQAADGVEAVEFLNNEKVDLVITDIKMPQMDGLQLADYIFKNKNINSKVIILSGYYDFSFAQAAIRYSVVDYVLKPLKKADLIAVLETFKSDFNIQNIDETEEKQLNIKHLSSLINGKFKAEDISYISKLPFYGNSRLCFAEVLIKADLQEDISIGDLSIVQEIEKEMHMLLLPENGIVTGKINRNKDIENIEIGLIIKEEVIAEYLEELLELRGKFNIKLWLLVGKTVCTIEDLHLSFQSLYNIKLIHGVTGRRKNLFCDKDIVKYSNMNYFLPAEYSEKLIYAIKRANKDEILNAINLIYSDMEQQKVHPIRVKDTLQYLLYQCIADTKKRSEGFFENPVETTDLITCYGDMDLFLNLALELASFEKETSTTDSVLNNIEMDIQQHFAEPLSLKELGEKYFVNSVYLGQLFKKKYKVSFKEYLNGYRIEKAAELLLSTNERVYEIASAVGYNNTDYFINRFVQQKGETPYQYRLHFTE